MRIMIEVNLDPAQWVGREAKFDEVVRHLPTWVADAIDRYTYYREDFEPSYEIKTNVEYSDVR